MSLTKKDPSLRVAATDPHLVSLGGGRLSTAVTIHYIHIGDTTIGSSTACSISLNGSGVRAIHCTIYRSEDNEVTIVPAQDARILIDGAKITEETNLTQGAMITIGNSNYLRFNNPDEAMMMRSAIGSNERISMPQIDFTQMPNGGGQTSTTTVTANPMNKVGVGGAVGHMVDNTTHQSLELESYFESIINPNHIDHQQQQQIMSKSMIAMPTTAAATAPCSLSKSSYKHISPAIDVNGIQCPKVFTADLVTVNMPAKDVLGQKYASFAKNLAENHRNEKHMNNTLKCNSLAKSMTQQQNGSGNGSGSNSSSLTHIPSVTNNYLQHTMMQPAASSTPMSLGKYKTNVAGGTGGGNGNGGGGGNTEQLLTKVQNTNAGRGPHSQANIYTYQTHQNHINAYDRYPKPGTYGGLQIFPMNGVNTEINNGANAAIDVAEKSNLAYTEAERLEDMLKICTEYANQSNNTTNNMSNSNNSITSSPIVQNRIKTNGSLPREKKSPFHHDLTNAQWYSGSSGNLAAKPTLNSSNVSTSSGYENVRLIGPNRVVEINGQVATSPSGASIKSGYENVSVMSGTSGGKYVPQSPRTKIRTTCMSPKKDVSFGNSFGVLQSPPPPIAPKPLIVQPLPPAVKLATKQREYDQLIKSFERRLQLEMKAIEESSRYKPNTLVDSISASSATSTPSKRLNKNVNNLTLNLQQSHSLQNSPKLSKKPTPAPRLLNKSMGVTGSAQSLSGATEAAVAAAAAAAAVEATNAVSSKELKRSRLELKARIKQLTAEIADLQTQTADEQLAELNETSDARQSKLQTLQTKIHRLEAQRNATRVMEENQQAKLKQTIEMKQEQVKNLKAMLKQKPNNECLKEELEHVCESLESDRKTFEDLEFQYFEEESEFHACYEELKKVEKRLTLENELATCMERLSGIKALDDDEHNSDAGADDDDDADDYDTRLTTATKPITMPTNHSNLVGGVMSQSLFGSAELLCPKRASEDIMSKSVNENMFYNHKIELPRVETSTVISTTSTPKRAQFQVYDIDVNKDGVSCGNAAAGIEDDINDIDDDDETQSPFNLSLRGERFAVNPLERRVPSQDDIDRSCKVASDAPISATRGPSTKIFDSIREIERNRKLLLAQQGHHVIEHERQKMYDLKKKSHDEARTQYLLTMNAGKDHLAKNQAADPIELQKLKPTANFGSKPQNDSAKNADQHNINNNNNNSNKQRHSQPELELQHATSSSAAATATTLPPPPLLPRSPRPLSEANSDRSYELLETNTNNALGVNSPNRTNSAQSMELASAAEEENKRASTNSNETGSAGSGGSSSGGGGGERKRALAKHQRPLTRYLPIFSPDLNLRHHIESAGHQIDLCPHVFVDAHSCRGYLHKLGATFHAWSRRWFVLDRQRSALIYYSDKSERKPRGGAYFATIDEVYLDHLNASKSGRPHCTFIVKTKKRSYNLQAASDAAARIWIDAIITGAQGNLDY